MQSDGLAEAFVRAFRGSVGSFVRMIKAIRFQELFVFVDVDMAFCICSLIVHSAFDNECYRSTHILELTIFSLQLVFA